MIGAAEIAALPPDKRAKLLADLSPEAATQILYSWEHWARDEQREPEGDWAIWLLLAGRGFGKTRTGAEHVRELVERGYNRIALVAPTAADARDVMVEGESGILATSPPWARPKYEPSKRRLTWPNGAIATTYSADESERLRGPQHDAAWCDEIAAWRYPETWDMLMFGLRLGARPVCIATTTPRPTPLIKDLLRRARGPDNPNGDVVVGRGSSYDNRANLAPQFFEQITRKYQGTRLGRQELDAELLEDVPGALFSRELIEASRVSAIPELSRVVVAIDPAVTSGEDADETGIVVAGKDARHPAHGYVLADCSGRMAPIEWARVAIAAYKTHQADRIVAEVNNGGEMVEATLRMVDPNIPFTAVHATRGKVVRAEPVAALYEQGRVHHHGCFPQLEDQQAAFTTDLDRKAFGSSPDRVDACIAEGTLVETDRGAIPIERIVIGDRVLTRKGYRKVTAARMTSANAGVVRIVTTFGELVATPDHKIGTEKGFVPIDALGWDDIIISCIQKKTPQSLSFIWASNFVDSQTAQPDPGEYIIRRLRTIVDYLALVSFTLKFGEMQTIGVLFPRVMSYTTGMTTPLTTTPKTSLLLLVASMRGCMLNSRSLQRNLLTWSASGRWRANGMPVKKDLLGIRSMLPKVGLIGRIVNVYVRSAAKYSKLGTHDQCGVAHALVSIGQMIRRSGIHAKSVARSVASRFGRIYIGQVPRLARAHVVRSCEPAGKAAVYDLSVEGEHEFFAGGMLVHNCVWAFSELLVENIPSAGIFESYRLAAERAKSAPKPVIAPVYAPGSVEWMRANGG